MIQVGKPKQNNSPQEGQTIDIIKELPSQVEMQFYRVTDAYVLRSKNLDGMVYVSNNSIDELMRQVSEAIKAHLVSNYQKEVKVKFASRNNGKFYFDLIET